MLNVLFINFYVTQSELRKQGKDEFTEDDIPFFFHFLFNKMNTFFSTYGKLDICWDGSQSLEWRRSIYPDYKRNRDKRKSENSYKTLMSTIPKVSEGLWNYPCRQITVARVEADDIIYALSERYKDEEITIISSDKDLVQICNFFDRVTVFNPIKFRTTELNENIIEEKAVCGDASDNIPGLYRVGIKTFEKMLADHNLWAKKISEKNNKEIFEKFLKIIDLRRFPYKQDILDVEEKLKYNEFNPDLIEMFYWENKLKDLMGRWTKTKEGIRSKL